MKTKKISLAVKKANEDVLDIVDDYACILGWVEVTLCLR